MIIVAVALIFGAMAFFNFFFSSQSTAFSGSSLGLVKLEGFIGDADPITSFMADLESNPNVKGVLLRINSPGGAVAPSQEIYSAVKSLAQVKPVVASFGTVAASGGYYAAAPATIIVANPASITGSIGVKAEMLNFSQLMKKIGITQESITSGKLKSTGSPFAPMTEEQKKFLKQLVMDMHRQFVDDVAKSRKLPVAEVEKVADGRALTGKQALALGLVDKLGSKRKAIAILKATCGLTGDVNFIQGPSRDKPFWLRFLGETGLIPKGLWPGQQIFVW